MTHLNKTWSLKAALLGTAILLPGAAIAQQQAQAVLEEIVVTAEKREQSLKDVSASCGPCMIEVGYVGLSRIASNSLWGRLDEAAFCCILLIRSFKLVQF